MLLKCSTKASHAWPDEAEERLKDLRAQGMSYSKIADVLYEEFKDFFKSGVTKSSVSGKIKRLKIVTPEKPVIKKPKSAPIAEIRKTGVSLMDAKNMQCRWIENNMCCGRAVKLYAKPYCDEHYSCVYMAGLSEWVKKYKEYIR